MEDKIIIDRMDAEEFLAMLMDAAKQDNRPSITAPPRLLRTSPAVQEPLQAVNPRLSYRRDGGERKCYDLS